MRFVIICTALFCLAIVVLLVFLKSPEYSYGGRSVFEIDTLGVIMPIFIFAVMILIMAVLGASNIYYGKKSEKTDFSSGERRTFLTMQDNDKANIFAEINEGGKCPECNLDLGQYRYCPRYGFNLSE
jgi:hypothetical protein